MGYEVTGKLHIVNETKQITERFQKREFVIQLDDNPQYPQFVQFQLTGKRCDSLDGFNVGDEVRVDFSLRGREWKSPKGEVKFFNSLDVWTIESLNAGAGGCGCGREYRRSAAARGTGTRHRLRRRSFLADG